MSEVKVNKISPRTNCGTVTLGDSGDSFVIPAGATITNNGTQTGFGREGSVNWQTGSIKTTTFTAVSGEGYFVDTSSGSVTANLPAGTAGAIVAFADYTRTFGTNSLTIAPNGSNKIGGTAASAKLTIDGQATTFVFVDSTEGWINVQNAEDTEAGATFITATGGNTISTCGDYKIHTFTGPGTFTVCSVANIAARNEVSYIVVGGGGGGGGASTSAPTGYAGGGGGAGGFREQKSGVDNYTASPLNGAGSITVTATGFPITVGGGGGGTSGDVGTAGSSSTFSSITSAGGGFGANGGDPAPAGGPGGSGGASGGYGHYNDSPVTRSPGGTGNTPSVSPAQGSNGGKGTYTGVTAGGGGGGATAAGDCASYPSSKSTGGDGGAGAATLINPATGEPGPGPSRYYAGGGGGGNGYYGTSTGPDHGGSGDGGIGGGGDGGAAFLNTNSCAPVPTQGDAGTANTGGGGGGSQSGPSSSPTARAGNTGGSGIVIIRYRFQ